MKYHISFTLYTSESVREIVRARVANALHQEKLRGATDLEVEHANDPVKPNA